VQRKGIPIKYGQISFWYFCGMQTHSLIILASGGGSNAASLIDYFSNHQKIQVCGLWTNNPKAGVLQRNLAVKAKVFSQGDDNLIARWKASGASTLVLAGYLKAIPTAWIEAFEGSVYNIHPALLPAFGGKGMYGIHAHRAVIASGDKTSGLSIHKVTEVYDEGPLVFQMRLGVRPEESAEALQQRILEGEHWAFPRAIEADLLHQTMPTQLPSPWLA
jgi:phosphoribosylglycinamide formyltransferase-1|tara:strand:- start:4278 stop:4931 length:654 start_codon:yes stop_codon:yes gene_type:complete